MKNNLLMLVLILLAGPLSAQRIIEKKLPYKEGQTANLNLKFADSIQVRYWDKPEVYVKIKAVINGNKLNDALVVTDRATADEVILEIGFDDEPINPTILEETVTKKKPNITISIAVKI